MRSVNYLGIHKSFQLALHFTEPVERVAQQSTMPKLTIIIYCLQLAQSNYFQSSLLPVAKRYFATSYFQWFCRFNLVFVANPLWFHPVLYLDHSSLLAKNLNYCFHCYFINELLEQPLPASLLLALDYSKRVIVDCFELFNWRISWELISYRTVSFVKLDHC